MGWRRKRIARRIKPEEEIPHRAGAAVERGEKASGKTLEGLGSGTRSVQFDPRLAHSANAGRRADMVRGGQRTLGNRVVQQMLRRKGAQTEPEDSPAAQVSGRGPEWGGQPMIHASAPQHGRESVQVKGQNPRNRPLADGLVRGRVLSSSVQRQGAKPKTSKVRFTVHKLKRKRGKLDNPDQSSPGVVTWALSFGVDSPLTASADVEVAGKAGDPCTDYDVGFLQTVHSQWLHCYYWGRRKGDGKSTLKYKVPLPIRDGDPGAMWYNATSHAKPSRCGDRVKPSMDDYPTIFNLPKEHMNTKTNKSNYLRSITRGIHFVTTLVASGPTGVHPLRFFYWNYQMDINFKPNYTNVNAQWGHTWVKNKANLGGVGKGKDGKVPIFTTGTKPYNQSLTGKYVDRA